MYLYFYDKYSIKTVCYDRSSPALVEDQTNLCAVKGITYPPILTECGFNIANSVMLYPKTTQTIYGSTVVGSNGMYGDACGIQSYYIYESNWLGYDRGAKQYRVSALTKSVKDTLLQANIIEEDGIYPADGIKDGHWYIKKGIANVKVNIDGTDSNLGNKGDPFNIIYKFSDSDVNNTFTVTEKLDNNIIKTFTGNKEIYYEVDMKSRWLNLSLGSHTVIIEVNDGLEKDTRTYTFTKVQDRVEFTTKPIQPSIAAKKIVLSGKFEFPQDAQFIVYTCNNAFDLSPTWEDMTQKYKDKKAHSFDNNTKTADKWGIAIKIYGKEI